MIGEVWFDWLGWNLKVALYNWNNLNLQRNVDFGVQDTKYSPDYADERQYIIDTFGWTIKDEGEANE